MWESDVLTNYFMLMTSITDSFMSRQQVKGIKTACEYALFNFVIHFMFRS